MPPFYVQGQRVFGKIGGAERNAAHFFVSTGEGKTVGFGMVDEGIDHPERDLEYARSNSGALQSPENRDRHSGTTEHSATAKSNEVATNEAAKHEAPSRRFPKVPWFIDTAVPALICPINPFWSGSPGQESSRWIIIELDQDFLRQHLFPELAARYFADSNGFGYDVAVVDHKNGAQDALVFGSRLALSQADAKLDLFGLPGLPRAMNAMAVELRSQQKAILNEKHEFSIGLATHDLESSFAPPLLLMSAGPGDGNWLLVVRNRLGSLEAAASSLRRRELGFSFGVLLILAGTMAMLIAASRRAHRLARLQMDFVAGVSHELRTPLAVISSAAENIADGVIENQEQIARYGNVIKNQSAQLKQLVEQILLFAATRHGRQHYTLRLSEPAVVIDRALENTAEVIRTAGITVEKNIQSNLPPIPIDVDALAHSLQNLIMNAVKYGGDPRWIGVTAAKQTNANGTEVTITISDRGIGIGVDEMEHVFDPFFRGAAVREAQIHGSGLGLPLAKSIVEAMGGHITIDSTPGSGSSFTVHLPVPKTAAWLSETIERPAVGSERLIQSHE
jgi:signal transduction histidine kinase